MRNIVTIILCIKIFIARIIDVSLGTIKTFYIVKEKRIIASIIAFIETLIWILVVKETLNNKIDSIFIPLSYSLGFSVGTYMGIFISNKIIKGTLSINVISSCIKKKEIKYLKQKGYGVTVINLNHNQSHLLIEIEKNNLKKLKKCLNELDKNAFIIINESKIVDNGFFI